MHVETRYYLIFQNILETTKNFQNPREFFSSSAKYYFLQKFRYIQRNHLNLELISMKYFHKKRAGFCFLINLKFKKVVTSILTSFCTVRCIQAQTWNLTPPPPPLPVSQEELSLIVSNEQIDI